MRRFKLVRKEDVTGVSGTGIVAEGVLFSNGKVSICWLGEKSSVVLWENIKDAEAVHGHGGKTRFVWLEEPRDEKIDDVLIKIAMVADVSVELARQGLVEAAKKYPNSSTEALIHIALDLIEENKS